MMQFIDDEGNIHRTMKYKNKNGIELNYTQRNNIHTDLVKEVITEACKLISGGRYTEARLFLEENFDLENGAEVKCDE